MPHVYYQETKKEIEETEDIFKDNSIWNAKTLSEAPSVIAFKYAQLKQLTESRSYYGMMIALRDCFELFVRFYVLCSCAISRGMQSDDIVKVLCDPKLSLSFGDWVNTLTTAVVRFFGKNSAFGGAMQQMKSFYEKYKIVRWRNDYVGHGALADASSVEYQRELEVKVRELKQLLDEIELLYRIIRLEVKDKSLSIIYEDTVYPAEPFMWTEDEKIILFDSFSPSNSHSSDPSSVCRAINYYTGNRPVIDRINAACFFDVRKKYYGLLNIEKNKAVYGSVHRRNDDRVLNAYYDDAAYIKQIYMRDWLNQCMASHEKGVFLMLADRATGKSTFSYMLDGLGGNQRLLSNVTSRSYYCHRTSIRNFQDFTTSISRIFYHTPDGNDFLQQAEDGLPVLRAGEGEDPAAVMARLLNFCRDLYERETGTERLLLVIDGIDELETASLPVLGYIPMPDLLADNVYILLTCRADAWPAPLLQKFIQYFPLTEQKVFRRAEENHALLKTAISDALKMCRNGQHDQYNQYNQHGQYNQYEMKEEDADKLAAKFDDRFSALPLIRVLPGLGIDMLKTEPEEMYLAYLERIHAVYGDAQYQIFVKMLLTIDMANYPLTMQEAAFMATGDSLAVSHLAMFYDMKPLVVHYHHLFGGLLLGTGDVNFSTVLRNRYGHLMTELLEAWRELILACANTLPDETDGYASICVHFLELNERYTKFPCAFRILENLNTAAVVYGGERHEMYVLMRSQMIYSSILKYLEEHREDILNGRGVMAAALENKSGKSEDAIELMKNVVYLNSMKGLFAANDFDSLLKMEHEIEDQLTSGKIASKDIEFEYCMNFLILFKTVGNEDRAEYYLNRCLQLYPDVCEYFQKVFMWNYLNSIKDTKPEACIRLCRQMEGKPDLGREYQARLKYFEGVAVYTLLRDGFYKDGRMTADDILRLLDEGLQCIDDVVISPQNYEANITQALLHTARSKAERLLCHDYEAAVNEARRALAIHNFHRSIGNEDSYNNYLECCVELVRALNLRGNAEDLQEACENLKNVIIFLEQTAKTESMLHPYVYYNIYMEYAVVIMHMKGPIDELEKTTKKMLYWAERMPGGKQLMPEIRNNLRCIADERRAGNVVWIYDMVYKDECWQKMNQDE